MKYIDYNDPIITAINEGGGLKTTDTNIGFAPGYAAMVIPYNSTHKVYIRYGGNANSGKEQHEVVVVDKDGNKLSDQTITEQTAYKIANMEGRREALKLIEKMVNNTAWQADGVFNSALSHQSAQSRYLSSGYDGNKQICNGHVTKGPEQNKPDRWRDQRPQDSCNGLQAATEVNIIALLFHHREHDAAHSCARCNARAGHGRKNHTSHNHNNGQPAGQTAKQAIAEVHNTF